MHRTDFADAPFLEMISIGCRLWAPRFCPDSWQARKSGRHREIGIVGAYGRWARLLILGLVTIIMSEGVPIAKCSDTGNMEELGIAEGQRAVNGLR